MFPLLFSETGLRDSHALKTYNKPQEASFIILLIFHLRNLTFSEVKSILLGSGSKLRSDYSKKNHMAPTLKKLVVESGYAKHYSS